MPGSVLGVITVNWLHDSYGGDFEPYLLGAVAVALAFASSATLYRALFRPGLIAKERHHAVLEDRVKKLGTGRHRVRARLRAGAHVGGVGCPRRPRPDPPLRLRPRRVVGTDVFHAAVLLWTAGLANLAYGNVNFGLMGTLLLGSLPGVWIGTALGPVRTGGRPALRARHHPGCRIARGRDEGGADLSPGVLAGVPVALAIFTWIIHRRHPMPLEDHPAEARA
jgi:uncharacterized membrane protein YfcA